MGLLCCPLCGEALLRQAGVCRCGHGHCFDVAAQNYVNLTAGGRGSGRLTGDSPEMCRARTAFLERGYYAPLREAVARLCGEVLGSCPAPRAVDAGCGEGYYTQGVWEVLSRQGAPELLGVDLAKTALKRAGRRCPQAEFALASLFHLPVADGAADLVLSVFAPVAAEEFGRVLRQGGALLVVTPGPRHLWGMKEVLYPAPYENRPQVRRYPGFRPADRVLLEETVTVSPEEDIRNLFLMTPYAWKTGEEAARRLLERESLETEISFFLDLYRREM